MATIAIFGGTGYAGSAIRDEALRRGHRVISVTRSGTPDGARYAGFPVINNQVEYTGKADWMVRQHRVSGRIFYAKFQQPFTGNLADYASMYSSSVGKSTPTTSKAGAPPGLRASATAAVIAARDSGAGSGRDPRGSAVLRISGHLQPPATGGGGPAR